MFNFNQCMRILNVKAFIQDDSILSYKYEGSDIDKDKDHEHIVTGNLRIKQKK